MAIGAGVPLGSFGFAWLTMISVNSPEEVWIGASMVGMTSVLCASFLASKEFARRARAEARAHAAYEKPYLDADAYDVAGSRG